MTRAQALAIAVISGVAAYVVSDLTERAQRRTREAESLARQGRRVADEQAALRRVATLVAQAAPPEEVFAAVTAELGRLLPAEMTLLNRYDPAGTATTVTGAWARQGAAVAFPVGTRWSIGGRNVSTLVMETGQAARIDDYGDAEGVPGGAARERGIRSSVGVPIRVDGRLWGHMSVASTHEQPFLADTEARLAGFAELVATAIANAQARVELRGFAEEQAALRRVATLVARAAPPEEMFAAVAAEVGRVLACDFTLVSRYDPDRVATVVGAWGSPDRDVPVPVGHRLPLEGRTVSRRVYQTSRPARIDRYGPGAGPAAAPFVAAGIRSVAGAPINVEGRLWGVMIAMTREQPLQADIEARLVNFTELVSTAIANAEVQAELTASRARIVATADQTRRRIERDLHDGAQQRLVSLALQLRAARATLSPEANELAARLDDLAAEATSTLDELRELARGIHPVVLVEGGLAEALNTLAHRATIPVKLDVRVDRRLPEQVDIAIYYLVAEALTNACKHAHASAARVTVETDAADLVLRVAVCDDGAGGAKFARGTGLVGLKDRVEALGGRIYLDSPLGAGTSLRVELPLTAPTSGLASR